ncbi:MAG TPA: hypothetical protein VK622_11285 [Puia sp.]|nr:hypothetical protein [Puia sp.]
MKLIFFLIAFCLVSIRFYFAWSGNDKEKRGITEGKMINKSDHYYEEINYSGKFELSEDESKFNSISPGGYFKFRRNDIKVKAESNLRGEIEYTIYDGKNNLPLNEQTKRFVSLAIKEMIYWGYDANERMERIYRKGGAQAVLNEVDSVKTDQLKILYLNHLFNIDSLLPGYLPFIMKKIATIGSDQDKVNFLAKITDGHLNNSSIDSAYFDIVKGIGSDRDKAEALQNIINKDTLAKLNIDKILLLTGELGSDMDKANLLQKVIAKGLVKDSNYNRLLTIISEMGSDMDKANLFKELVSQNNLYEWQWIKLQDKISMLGSDNDKTNLLIQLAPRMPQTRELKENYQKTAKTVGNDNDYGRAMRALQ